MAMRNRLGLLMLAALWCAFAGVGTAAADEFRGFWADAFHAGYKNASEVAAMVGTAKSNNFNAVVVEIRKRGDCYYVPTAPNTEPRATDIASDFDPLGEIITQAHAQGLQVHAWVVAMHVWSDQTHAPASTSHIYNAHPEWLTRSSAGASYLGGYFLDPGVPAAMDWNYNVCMDLVQHYNIDGLHLDYIRFPQQDAGYNPIALARFNAEFGRSGQPAPADAVFSDWRRRQITDFVKRVYVNAVALKPNLVVSAATYGSRSDAYGSRFQDWVTWMDKGYLDANMPMGYTSDNAVFESRTDDAWNNRFGRHLYKGQGSYLNTISNSMTQLGYIRSKGCEGMMTYSYQETNSAKAPPADFYGALRSQVFTSPANVPAMSWKTNPTQGILTGTVTTRTAAPVYNATITLSAGAGRSDGSGFYALTKLAPGSYDVTCAAPGYPTATGSATVSAGSVSTLDFHLAGDGIPPVISNARAEEVFSNSATILWDTDIVATSQVEYGTTTAYGSLTAEDSAPLTAHGALLSGLSPITLYHCRVISRDGSGDRAVSGDFTFTTAASGVVADIIIDNDDGTRAGAVGAWTVGSSSSDKYGADYAYAAIVAPPETKSFRWTPNILTAGDYQVSIWYPQGSNRNTGSPFTVFYNGGSQSFPVNQQAGGGQWNLLGTFPFATGTGGSVKLGNASSLAGNLVLADAVKFRFVPGSAPPPVFLIESRAGGQNGGWYGDSGLSDSSVKSAAPGVTSAIGCRYQLTSKKTGSATFQPRLLGASFPAGGYYRVSITWPNAASTRCAGGRATIGYDATWGGSGSFVCSFDEDSSSADTWVSLGGPLPFSGSDDKLTLDDQANTTNSGSYRFVSDAARFEYFAPLPPTGVSAEVERRQVTLRWTNPGFDFGGARIYRSDTAGVLGARVADALPGNTWTDTGRTPGTTCYYTVRALSAGLTANESPNANQVVATTLSAPATFTSPPDLVGTGWNLISLPAVPEDPDPLSVLANVDVPNVSFQYWKRDVDGGGYQLYGSTFGWTGPMQVGIPYWFLEENGPKTLSFQGDESSADWEIAIPAHTGAPYWVMLGQPFAHGTLCADVSFDTPSQPSPLSWVDAYAAGLVESSAQCFMGGSFVSVGPGSFMVERDRLEPWRGYWLLIRTVEPVMITVPVSPATP